ncbi:MAG: type II toxin-antitoxin system Phd/YefM family antitoxin [Treponema sp.]|nr:type II toxin-antitoxin system Phd/YefM family antitoxin [Treponema sp.]
MPFVSISKAKEKLDAILEEVQGTYEPLIIAGENHSAVLISEEVWRSYRRNLVFNIYSWYERFNY